MRNILFVCTGNTCRSPMAEGIFNTAAKKMGVNAVASSCGIFAGMPQPAAQNAIEVMEEYGTDIKDHMSRPVKFELMEGASAVFGMTEEHCEHLKKLYPEHTAKIFKLSKKDINDPFSGSMSDYREAASEIYNAVIIILEKMKNEI